MHWSVRMTNTYSTSTKCSSLISLSVMDESLPAFHAPTHLVTFSVIGQASHPYRPDTRTEATAAAHSLNFSVIAFLRGERGFIQVKLLHLDLKRNLGWSWPQSIFEAKLNLCVCLSLNRDKNCVGHEKMMADLFSRLSQTPPFSTRFCPVKSGKDRL